MIPVFQPEIGEAEIDAVVAALRRGEISGSFGESIPLFEREFAAYCGCKHGIAVSSGTAALHLAVDAAGIGAGDEVLVSASTNIATALAAYHNGAVPVGVDSEDTTWNMNLDLIPDLISKRTRAIIPVHLFGHPIDMDRLVGIARTHNLTVIEDCAESHGASCRGRMTGSFGEMACFSFYANKIITTGEGGMVVTNDDALAAKIRLLRNLAFTKPRFWHELPGYNFRMTGFQAAMGVVQCRKLEAVIEAKRQMASIYNRLLSGVPGIRTPADCSWGRHVYWMYGIVIDDEFGVTRDMLVEHLRNSGVESRTFFCPMNDQPCFEGMPGFRRIPCPVADRLWKRGLYLPSSHTLKPADIDTVCELVRSASRARA